VGIRQLTRPTLPGGYENPRSRSRKFDRVALDSVAQMAETCGTGAADHESSASRRLSLRRATPQPSPMVARRPTALHQAGKLKQISGWHVGTSCPIQFTHGLSLAHACKIAGRMPFPQTARTPRPRYALDHAAHVALPDATDSSTQRKRFVIGMPFGETSAALLNLPGGHTAIPRPDSHIGDCVSNPQPRTVLGQLTVHGAQSVSLRAWCDTRDFAYLD